MATPFEFTDCPACDRAVDLLGPVYTYGPDVVCSPGCVQVLHEEEKANAAGQ